MKSIDLQKTEQLALMDGATFNTNLVTTNGDMKFCALPTRTDAYNIDCGSANSDDLYSPEQCSVTCSDRGIKLGSSSPEFSCDQNGNTGWLNGCWDGSSLMTEVFNFDNTEDYSKAFDFFNKAPSSYKIDVNPYDSSSNSFMCSSDGSHNSCYQVSKKSYSFPSNNRMGL